MTVVTMQKTPRIWAAVIAAVLCLVGGAAPAAAQSYTIMPAPFQAPLNDTGAIIVGGCVWTYAAGTTTPISTYTNTSGTTNSNPIIVDATGRFTAYLLAGTNYKFVYETACTPPAHGAVLRTADNIAGVPAAAATVDVSGLAGETITAGQCAYLSVGSGGKTPGQWYKCDAANTYSSTLPELGIAPSTILSGVTGTIREAGSVSGLSALTIGEYFVGTAGALTATAPTNSRHLGFADSSASVIASANPRPQFGTMTNGQLIIGSTAAAPALATLTAGSNIAITNAAGAITVAGSVFDKSLTEQIVTNTAVETAIYSKAIAANTLVAGTAFRLTLSGTPVNSSGGAINFTLAIKLGATTLFSGVLSVGNGTSLTPWTVFALVNANNASNSQRADVTWQSTATNIADGGASVGPGMTVGGHSAAAVDMTTTQTLQVTITMASAASTITFKRWAAILELVL